MFKGKKREKRQNGKTGFTKPEGLEKKGTTNPENSRPFGQDFDLEGICSTKGNILKKGMKVHQAGELGTNSREKVQAENPSGRFKY